MSFLVRAKINFNKSRGTFMLWPVPTPASVLAHAMKLPAIIKNFYKLSINLGRGMTSKISFNCPAGRKIHYTLPRNVRALSHHDAVITSYQKQPRAGDIYIFVFTNVFIAALKRASHRVKHPVRWKCKYEHKWKWKIIGRKIAFHRPKSNQINFPLLIHFDAQCGFHFAFSFI